MGSSTRYVGHNPASAYAALAMFLLVAGITGTGIMLASGNREVKEAHEVMVYALVGVVAVHILGVLLHTLRFRENIILSMINGKKRCEASCSIASARPVVAAVFLVVAGLWAVALVRSYDAGRRSVSLPVVGTSLHIGENGKDGKNQGGHERHDDDDD